MIKLHRNLRFYAYTIILILALFIIFFIIYLIFEKDSGTTKKLFFTILLSFPAVFIVYILVDLFLRVPHICFSKEQINVGSKNLSWKEIKKVVFNLNAQYLGYPQIITFLNVDTKSIKLYNQYYQNFELLYNFIRNEQPAPASVEPASDFAQNKTFIDTQYKLYKGYRLSTHLLISIYSLFIIVMALRLKTFDISGIIVTFPFILFALLSLYLPNYIMIENGQLIIKKLLLPMTPGSVPLQNLYALKYYSNGRGPREMMWITKDLNSRKFYMETLPVKKFKELKTDLESAGVVVIDDVTPEPMNMTFNTSFNIFGKKPKK